MKIHTSLKAGGMGMNHNQSAVAAKGLRVRTKVRAGGMSVNHNQSVVGGASRS